MADRDTTTGTHDDAIEPLAALRRIAFLMERSRGEMRRVEAFRKAAATIVRLDPQELADRAAAGTLTELSAIGASTGRVIAQAIEGRRPDYLLDLEAAGAADPLVQGSEPLLTQLRGDLHSHSNWSDGGSPIEEMVATAMELGREYLALTDHSRSLRVANGLSEERLRKQLEVVAAVDAHVSGSGFRLLAGIEVDILADGSLDQEAELLERLDVVVASVHSKLRSPAATMTKRMLGAIQNPRTNVLGHCTGRLVEGGRGTRPPSQFDARAVFEACVEHDVAVEINSRPERCDPPDELIELALEIGCLFSIDTDSHAPGQLDFLAYGAARAQRLGVPAERIVTTWECDRLLEWAARR
ncbi:MAG: PHP domain-containing protein [Micrococcales bacterium]|nr:PHP domain-containing protein [Micrococcales bacterium]